LLLHQNIEFEDQVMNYIVLKFGVALTLGWGKDELKSPKHLLHHPTTRPAAAMANAGTWCCHQGRSVVVVVVVTSILILRGVAVVARTP
jgi:hypothetical protein